MDDMLMREGRKLEDLFFAEQDALLIAKHKELAHRERTQNALADVSGITNPDILRKLVELEINPDLLASLAVVPLVEVAWADGHVHDNERKAILEGAMNVGIGKGTVDFDLLEEWLSRKPPPALLEAWDHYIAGLCEVLTPEECKNLETGLLTRARAVAEASGGLLGLVLKVSAAEQAVLDQMARAFVVQPVIK